MDEEAGEEEEGHPDEEVAGPGADDEGVGEGRGVHEEEIVAFDDVIEKIEGGKKEGERKHAFPPGGFSGSHFEGEGEVDGSEDGNAVAEKVLEEIVTMRLIC